MCVSLSYQIRGHRWSHLSVTGLTMTSCIPYPLQVPCKVFLAHNESVIIYTLWPRENKTVIFLITLQKAFKEITVLRKE